MKKIYIYTSIMLLTLAGCKKELIQNPSNAVNTNNAYVTEADFTNAVLGAYSAMIFVTQGTVTTTTYYGGQDGGSMATTPDVLSDNVVLNQQGRKSEQDFFNFKYTGNNTWNLWQNAYSVIGRANNIITNIGHLKDGTFKNNILGEALAIRALAHFDLLRVYAKSYTSASATDPGVPYVTSVDPSLLPSRTPDKTAYDMVVADLVQAQGVIGADNGAGRMNKPAVEGILSRVYLYRGEWQNCVTAATASITDATATGHQLASTDNFGNIWIDADNLTSTEVLFRVIITDQDNDPIGVGYEQASPNGVKPEYSVDFGLYTLYTNNDVRKAAYIDTSTFNGILYNYVKKYFGRATGNANVVDYKVIRLGEVYLNRAEAYYNLANQAAARTDLNTLRSNRYTGFVPGAETGTTLYTAILLQRRLELAFEGSRFFDIKRLNLPLERSSFGDNGDGKGTPASVKTVPATSNLFQLPIPIYEINVNKNVTQNPGY
ncbi:MAG: Starch-binding associating with outer rane [Mucilaginibacter sp.]|nr:Starch-binding associating with outer rane [Mucilaginibacter sp.]